MCDTVVVVDAGGPSGQGGAWLAKNSDREPGEPQTVEHLPRRRATARTLRCTHVEVPEVDETFEVVLSRPSWMWGAEMGVNERGVAIGNEAVFTREKLDAVGLTGMDLLRLALERSSSAREAVDVIARLLAAHGQGGRMGYRNRAFSYASSFLIADATEAWVLETAGRRWAAERVASGVRSISNALTIDAADLVSEGASRAFASAYSDPVMSALAGATRRRACTASAAGPSFSSMARALRDHGGREPRDGLVMSMPCAHASFLPTRTSGQTTGSMIVQLSATGPHAWLTGTSSPCISAFKPVPLGTGALVDTGPAAGERFDDASLFWRHERLHRRLLADLAWPADLVARVRARADELEARGQAPVTASEATALWSEHRDGLARWLAELPSRAGGLSPTSMFWRQQRRLEGMPS